MNKKRLPSDRGASSTGPVKKVKYGDVTHVPPSAIADGSDDEEAFEDNVQYHLEKSKRKAHRQRIEEYDSDASSADEGDFNGVKKNNLEEEDLFAIEDHDLRPRSKKAAKENTIEDDQAEEADPTELYTAVRDVNEEDGATVQKDIPLEPFNMRAVLEEGSFNEEGVYTENKDDERQHDNWLQGLTAKDIQKAAEAHAERLRREQEQEAQSRHMTLHERLDRMAELLQFMEPRETVAQAMKRLGSAIKILAVMKKQRANHEELTEQQKEELEEKRRSIEKMTDLADAIMGSGHTDIYEETYEDVVALLCEHRHPSQSTSNYLAEPKSTWKYKWSQEAQEEFGPFSEQQMKAWQQQGYFEHNSIWVQRGKMSNGIFDAQTDFQLADAQYQFKQNKN